MTQNRLACLVKIKTNTSLSTRLIVRDQFIIGRSNTADLPIIDPWVSRQHARIEISPNGMTIFNLSSNNVITINSQKVDPGGSSQIDSESVVRLGSSESEMIFTTVPAPLEVLSPDEQKNILIQSMKDVERDTEAAVKRVVDEERKKIIEALKHEEDVYRQKLEKNLKLAEAKIQQDLYLARQKAESIVASARDEGTQAAKAVLAEADQKYANKMAVAETERTKFLQVAQNEAEALVREANFKAKVIIEETKKKADTLLLDTRRRAEFEADEAKRAALDTVRLETFAEQEKILKDYRGRIEKLNEIRLELESQVSNRQSELERLNADLDRLKGERVTMEKYEIERRLSLSQLEEDLEHAQKIIRSADEAEKNRLLALDQTQEAKNQAEEFRADYERQKQSIQDDLQRLKQQSVIEFESFRKKKDEEMVEQKLKALEQLKITIEQEESRYQKTLQLRSSEISTSIEKKLLQRIQADLKSKGVDVSLASFLEVIKSSVDEVVVKDPVEVTAMTQHLGVDPERIRDRSRKFKRMIWMTTAGLALVVGIYGGPIYDYLKSLQNDHSQTQNMATARRAESIYLPIQNDDWHETYVGNILYLRYYYETKLDSVYQEQWALRMNNLELLRTFHLSEDDMVQFIGKERALIKQLGEMKQTLDAKFIEEGLGKMNQVESQTTAEMKKILKSDENFLAVKKIEKDFVTQFIKVRFGYEKSRSPTSQQ